jgi:hypothetical protein
VESRGGIIFNSIDCTVIINCYQFKAKLLLLYDNIKDHLSPNESDPLYKAARTLPGAFPTLASSAGTRSSPFPGIFDAGAQIDLIQAALKSSDSNYPSKYLMPSLPPTPETADERTAELYLLIKEGVEDLNKPFAHLNPAYKSEYEAAAKELAADYHEWLIDTIRSIQDPDIIDSYTLPQHFSILILRVLLFLSRYDTDFNEQLLVTCSCTFGAIAAHRYSKSVLLAISKERKTISCNRPAPFRITADRIVGTLEKWVEYSKQAIRQELSNPVSFPE